MNTIDSIANIAHRHKGHWFDPDTMRFFKSRTYDYGYISNDGTKVYFVSSEKGPFYESPRLYTVRVQDIATGDIKTAPTTTFQQFTTKRAADKAAEKLARS